MAKHHSESSNDHSWAPSHTRGADFLIDEPI